MIEQVKGTRNLYGLEAQKYLYIYDIFRRSFNTYGYDLIELPTIEYKELFNKSIGENSEIVTKHYILKLYIKSSGCSAAW